MEDGSNERARASVVGCLGRIVTGSKVGDEKMRPGGRGSFE